MYSLDTATKKYVERFAAFLATNPQAFYVMAQRYEDRSRSASPKPWETREFIANNYELADFDLFLHLPDTAEFAYISYVLITGHELLGEARRPVADPAFGWLTLPWIKQNEIARRLGVNDSIFTRKLRGVNYNKFSEDEIIKLAQIREQLINELRPGAQPVDWAEIADKD